MNPELEESTQFHALAQSCQRFIGAIVVVEPGVFLPAVRRLTSESPKADTPSQVAVLQSWLPGTAMRGALSHHQLFHRLFGGVCSYEPGWPSTCAGLSEEALQADLIQWAEMFSREFDREHCWPPAVKAATLLQQAVGHAWYVPELARAAGASSSTLERSFKRLYGVSPQQYYSLLRLRSVAHQIHFGLECVEGLIRQSGCRSAKDVYRALRQVAGLTPAAIRQLTESQFADLIDGPLALPIPGISHRCAPIRICRDS
jgi:AraC-like DNA-binding protein